MGKYRPKKTMVAHRRFVKGGGIDEPQWKKDVRESEERLAEKEKVKYAPPKQEDPSYWSSVKDRVKDIAGKAKTPPAPAITDVMQDEGKRTAEASGFKKGGTIKARGVGIAQRGYGRAR